MTSEAHDPQRLAGASGVLEHATGALGLELTPGEVTQLLERTAASLTTGAPTEWLGLAAEHAGLRTTTVTGPLERVSAQAQPDSPLATALPAVPGAVTGSRWLILVGTRGGRVRFRTIESEERGPERAAQPRRLAEELGIQLEEDRAWVALQAATPCASASSHAREKLHPVRRLALLLRPDRADLWAILAFSIATGVLLLATPIAVQALVNFVAFGGAIPPLVVVSLLLLGALGFAAVLNATQTWVVEILQRRIFVRMVADLAARLPRVTLSARGHGYGPELVNRFFDIVTVQKVGSALLLDGLSMLLSVLVGLVVLAFYHPLLLAFDIVLLVVIALVVLAPARRGMKTAILESKAKYRVAAWLEEIARNPVTFKAAGAERWVFTESDRLARDYLVQRRNHYRTLFGQIVGVLALQACASTALLAIGGLLVIQGSLTLGQLVAAELIVTLVVGSVAKMGKHIEGFYDLTAAVDKIGELLDLPTESGLGEHPPHVDRGVRLTLERVAAAQNGGARVFSDLSLDLAPGGSLGVTGETGSGKSLLLELCWGLRAPAAGSIRFDGRDLRDLAPAYLRGVASLTASHEIVAGTLRDNVRLARSNVTDDDVRHAIRLCGLEQTVAALKDGLDTRLAADGYPLAAGEIQSLIAARAIVARPRLLLFDGALDALAPPDRREILDVLFAESAPWTLVIVSNSREVLERCEHVLEMPAGRLRSRKPALQSTSS